MLRMNTDLRTWWNSLDSFWTRIFKIMLDSEMVTNRTKRDSFVPTDADLLKLISMPEVNLSGVSISSLKPILVFTNLNALSISGLTKLTSIAELPSFSKLKALNIGVLPVSSYSDVSQCTGLESLTIGIGSISLGLIKTLKNLKSLTLNEPLLQNLDGIENLAALEALTIRQSTFGDFSPLACLTHLKRLYIEKSNLLTLEAIAKITSLEELDISNAPLNSLAGIESLTKLSKLTISTTNVNDLSPLNRVNPKTEVRILNSSVPLTQQVRHLNNVYVQPTLEVSHTNGIGEKIPFPFKQNKHYRVIKEWYRNGTTFAVGQELAFDHSDYNHYDDVEICYFKDLKQGYLLGWPCHSTELSTWKDYFEKIEYKN
jgi:hypothetical protein